MIESFESVKIYDSDIELHTDDYISKLDDSSLIYKTMVFNGLLHYLYEKIFKFKGNGKRYNNKSSVIDYNDTVMINHLIDLYVSLCFRYNHIPTILGFSMFSGIDNTTISLWSNGDYRNNSKVIEYMGIDKPLTHFETVKRLKDISEQALLSNAAENSSIGSIFALKCNYSYNDQPKTEVLQTDNNNVLSIDDIKTRYEHENIAIPEID